MSILHAALVGLPARAVREQPTDGVPRLPTLERLLARGRRTPASADWRRWALASAGLSTPDGDLPLGRLLAAANGVAGNDGDTWLLATPLRLAAGLTAVRVEDRTVRLSAAAAAALAAEFNAEWRGAGATLHAFGSELVLREAAVLELVTVAPELLGGRELAASLPTGRDAARATRLMTEIQMWLHALPARDGARAFNALWLWGAGRGGIAGSAHWPVLEGTDPYLAAARQQHPGTSEPAARLVRWSVDDLLLEGKALADAEREWFAPLARALADGTLTSAAIHLEASSVGLSGAQRFRFWSASRPWWEFGT